MKARKVLQELGRLGVVNGTSKSSHSREGNNAQLRCLAEILERLNVAELEISHTRAMVQRLYDTAAGENSEKIAAPRMMTIKSEDVVATAAKVALGAPVKSSRSGIKLDGYLGPNMNPSTLSE